eukprot:CAMPEP_0170451582 /NCGR_PEP_ID=MMETSP0123-20130129/772_1 /TAXON_ID=182087 /ORGANISM="Favella ehrenbergii, Strain Fehren 1" /LENGTH=81 /DNA_ID=CAMNT_0010713315 /DNA_START=1079 /DNA_END=1324 /DNA_ORIENTATION=+
MQLPPVTTEDVSPVVLELQTSTDMFDLTEDILTLKRDIAKGLKPDSCPFGDQEQIDLSFKLSSKVMGESEQTLQVQISIPE